MQMLVIKEELELLLNPYELFYHCIDIYTDCLLMQHCNCFSLESVNCKCCNNYVEMNHIGPHQHHHISSVSGTEIQILTSGSHLVFVLLIVRQGPEMLKYSVLIIHRQVVSSKMLHILMF